MKDMLKRVLCAILSITLLLSLAACAKQSSSQEPDSSSPADQSAAVSEAAPEEGGTEYQTYEIPIFGLQFDCPADFGDDVESRVISDDIVSFGVNAEDRIINFGCSRMPVSAKDLDVAAAIDKWKEGGEFKTFELLDSFSTPDSYGFYYIGEDSFEGDLGTQLCYRYVNYGGFVDSGGVINVGLQIVVPESVDQEAFTAFCEALTSSLRLSDSEAPPDGAPSGPEGGKSGLKALSGGTSDVQCEEIVNMFFEYASLVRYGAPSSDLMLLMGGNKDLYKALEQPGEILCSSHSFTSDLTFQNFEESGTSGGSYYINVIETRGYDEEELGTHEYLFTFCISINSPTDYCITGIDSEYMGAIDTSYHGPDYEESSGQDDPDELDEFDTMEEYYEMAMQRTFGANAQIDDHAFFDAIWCITSGDYQLAGMNPWGAYECYLDACEYLEEKRYTDTPLYDLAMQRLALAQEKIDIETEKRTSPW